MPVMSGAVGCMKERHCKQFKTYSGAVKIVREGLVAIAADDEGSISIWRRDDTGKLRGGFYRRYLTLDERDFANSKQLREWLEEWYPKMVR